MRLGDILAWLLVLFLAVGLFVVIPLIGWKMGEPLDRNGVKVLIIGVTVAVKLIHSLWSDEKPDSK
jgi:type III secretory pathway component EscT